MSTCKYCTKSFPNNGKLKRHLANIHDIGVVWNYCNVENCDYKCKDKYNLNKHKAHIHHIDVTWYICDVKGCTLKFKTSSDFKRHQSAAHDLNVKWFPCSLCTDRFKTKPNLDRHIRNFHNIGTVWYKCDKCDYKAKSKQDVKEHYARKHATLKNWYICEKCGYESVSKGDVDRHKRQVHHINVKKWYKCDVQDCNFKTTQKFRFKEHLENKHDIGDKVCDYCILDRYKLIPYKNGKEHSNICRTCFKKVTGKESRVELIMSKFLDEYFGTEYLIGSDSRIYGETCQRYRPDKIYASPGLVLHIECDEHQHLYHDGNYSCDEKRISSIYDEFPGEKYVIIRWNPDSYKVPPNRNKVSQRDTKLEMLLDCMLKLIEKPPEELIKIIYMFYNNDNPLLSKNIPHQLVYDYSDMDN